MKIELEYDEKKFTGELERKDETLVAGYIVEANMRKTSVQEIRELLEVAIQAEKFFLGLELLAYKIGLQKESDRIHNKIFDTDYVSEVNENMENRAIRFNISYTGQRKAIDVLTVKNMIENVPSYLKIMDMIGIRRDFF